MNFNKLLTDFTMNAIDFVIALCITTLTDPVGSFLVGTVLLGLATYRLCQLPAVNAPNGPVTESALFAVIGGVLAVKPFTFALSDVLAPYGLRISLGVPILVSTIILMVTLVAIEEYAMRRGPTVA